MLLLIAFVAGVIATVTIALLVAKLRDPSHQKSLGDRSSTAHHLFGEASNEAMAVLGTNETVAVNARFVELFGYTRDDISDGDVASLLKLQRRGQTDSPDATSGYDALACTAHGRELRVRVRRKALSNGTWALTFVERTRGRKAERRLAAQYQTARALSQTRDLQAGARAIGRAICSLYRWSGAVFWTVDHRSNRLMCLDVWLTPELCKQGVEEQLLAERLKPGQGVAGMAWAAGSPVVERHIRDSHPCLEMTEGTTLGGIASAVITRGEVAVVMEFIVPGPILLDDEIRSTLKVVGTQIGQYVDRQRTDDRIEQFFQLSLDLLCVTDIAQGRFALVNHAWERVLGYSRKELLGKHFVDYIHLPDQERTLAEFARLQDGATTLTFENRCRAKDGTIKWLAWAVRPVPSQGIVYAAGRDITDSKATEAELRQTNQFIDSIIENIPHMVFVKDADSLSFVRLNKAAEDLMGWRATDTIGKTDFDLFAANEARLFQQQDREALADKVLLDIPEQPIATEGCGERILHTKKIPILDAAGEPQYLLSMSEDITDRKVAEKLVKDLHRRNELILNSAGEGIYGLDAEGRATFVNAAAARLTGYAISELVGARLHTMLHHSHADGTRYPEADCPVYTALRDNRITTCTDEVYWRKDGTKFRVEYISSPLRSDGKVIGAVVVFRDISERLAVQQMKDEFLSVASHELRTPLTSIHGALGLLASGKLGALSSTAHRMVTVAATASDHLVRLTNDLLDLDRMMSGRMTFAKRHCELSHIMNEAAETMEGLAKQSDVEIKVTPTPLRLVVDPDRIVQTLTNLVSNAIKYAPSGTAVEVSAELEQESVVLCVRDHGRGIPADKREIIFERFQQADASDGRLYGGSGLGLAICRSIVTAHGGQIWAESSEGTGSQLYVRLPISAQLQSDAIAQIEEAS